MSKTNGQPRKPVDDPKEKATRLAEQITGRTGISPVDFPTTTSTAPSAEGCTVADTADNPHVFKAVDYSDLDEDLFNGLQGLAYERDTFKETAEAADAARKEKDEVIRAILAGTGYNRVYMPGGLVLEECRGRSESKISATRLVELGVDADIVARARVSGNVYYYLKYRKMSKEEEQAAELRERSRS
jgi:hypothetical protein